MKLSKPTIKERVVYAVTTLAVGNVITSTQSKRAGQIGIVDIVDQTDTPYHVEWFEPVRSGRLKGWYQYGDSEWYSEAERDTILSGYQGELDDLRFIGRPYDVTEDSEHMGELLVRKDRAVMKVGCKTIRPEVVRQMLHDYDQLVNLLNTTTNGTTQKAPAPKRTRKQA